MSKLEKKYEDILELIDFKLKELKKENIEKIPIRFLQNDFELCDLDEDNFGSVLTGLKDQGYIEKIVRPSEDDFMDVGYGEQPISTLEYKDFPGIFWINVSKEFHKLYKDRSSLKNKKSAPEPLQLIKIKSASLKKINLMIEINKGEIIILFKSKKGGGETNHWNIINHLWSFKKELDNRTGRVIKRGDWITLDNLERGAEIKKGTASKNISRLNIRFREGGIPIKVKPSGNGRCQLIVNYN